MPVYEYNAVAIDGRKQSGRVEVADVARLTFALKEEGLFLTGYRERKPKQENTKLKIKEIADFCRQLAAMLSSGITLIRAMMIIEQRDAKPHIKKVYTKLIEDLCSGATLSDGMEKQGAAFPPLLVNMIRAGESSGGIDKSALKMAETYDKQSRLDSKMKAAAVYPIILLVLIVGVIIVLFTFVLPQFAGLFETMGDLPLPTQIMMGFSSFLINYWMFIILAAVLIVAGVTALLRQPGPREGWDHIKLRAPVFGKLLKIICTARFARTLSALYVSGIPMLNTLQIAKTTVGNKYIENQFDEVVNALGNGQTLSVSLALVDGFEQKLISTILIGEESGRLEDMLGSVAEQYDYDAEIATQRLVSLMEPIMIVVMAAVVLAVIVSVLLPIFQMYSSLGA